MRWVNRVGGFCSGWRAAIADLQSKEAIEYGKTHITTNRQTWIDWLNRDDEQSIAEALYDALESVKKEGLAPPEGQE